MRDFGILLLRLTLGGFLAGHGAQKLFGAFEGPGIHGAGQWLESMGFTPGERWATMAGIGEFGGGLMTALGLMHPIGPITTVAPMAVAWGKAHWGKPIWVTSGGAELPVTNIGIALALALIGPGKFSMDGLFGMKPHPALAALASATIAAGTLMALSQSPQHSEAPEPEPAAAT